MLSYVCFALVLLASCNGQSDICTQQNAYYSVNGSCDAYLECKNYNLTEWMCPDGLYFNQNAQWPNYPCGYPQDIPCLQRGTVQPAQPTADCPHQYGYFASPSAPTCGQYRVCMEGQAFEMMCPVGLAFNPETSRCDWPDLVPTCKSDEFLGFVCPLAAQGKPQDMVVNYKNERNCRFFFSCQGGQARLLSCDRGLAFNPASGHCVDAAVVDCRDT